MRDYASFENLRKAAVLALPLTLLSAPRILLCELPFSFIIAAYIGLLLLGAMATAWSKYAGMNGLFPPAKDVKQGIVFVLVILVIIVPLQIKFFNPMLYENVSAAGDKTALEFLFPKTVFGAVALMLWSMSFETLFFRAAVMSFFAKLTGRLKLTILFSVLLSLLVGAMKLNQIDMGGDTRPVLFAVGVVSAVSCLVFARYGLLPAMLLAGGLALSRYSPL